MHVSIVAAGCACLASAVSRTLLRASVRDAGSARCGSAPAPAWAAQTFCPGGPSVQEQARRLPSVMGPCGCRVALAALSLGCVRAHVPSSEESPVSMNTPSLLHAGRACSGQHIPCLLAPMYWGAAPDAIDT